MSSTATTDGRGGSGPPRLALMDPATFDEGVPLEVFAEWRRTAPVFWHEVAPDQATGTDGRSPGGFWVVTRHEDVREVSRNPQVFSNRENTALLNGTFDEDRDLHYQRQLLLNMDPPRHTELRHIVQRGFTPRVISQLEEDLRRHAHDIVDQATAAGGGDFVTDVAAELPLQAICELVGVPLEDRHKIFELSNALVGSEDPEYADQVDTEQASAEIYMYGHELAEERRAEPRDDIVTELITADLDTEALTDDEFEWFFLLLLVAGNETTRNAITHGMQAFFDNPGQWELFTDQRPLETAAEEIVRWGTPVMQFQRTALSDYELSGRQIREGDRVAIYYSSANRDREVFDDPDTFDILRDPNPHIAFGGGGPHFCLGSSLAKLEIQVIFDVLADRTPDIAPTGPPERMRSMFLNAIKHLPVRYTG